MPNSLGLSVEFRSYAPSDFAACLALFDDNCPDFFAVSERADYQAFLSKPPVQYQVAERGGKILAAFGLQRDAQSQRGRLSWMMVSPLVHGVGVGSAMMGRMAALAVDGQIAVVDIAASHLSAPFFARFGARQVSHINHGWGEGMHRVDMELSL